MKAHYQRAHIPKHLKDHPLILEWKRERASLNRMVLYRRKKGLPLTDAAILKKANVVDDLCTAVAELMRWISKT